MAMADPFNHSIRQAATTAVAAAAGSLSSFDIDNPSLSTIMSPYNLSSSLPLTSYPSYHIPRARLLSWISDPNLAVLAPVIAYWSLSLIFEAIDRSQLSFFEKYRIHEPEEVKRKNKVSAKTVVYAVIVQQIFQTMLGWFILDEEEAIRETFRDHSSELITYGKYINKAITLLLGQESGHRVLSNYGPQLISFMYWWGVPVLQFIWASFLLDTWQYFWHRYFHTNKFLYRHIHSHHHRLYCPYSFGALYNHPLEGLLFDTIGTAFAHFASLMSTRQAILLFTISTLKTVDDHCGYALPWDPFQMLWGNNAAYHDIHHQQFGIKKNFSQPYFTHWDTILKTRMDPIDVPEKHREKYHGGPVRELQDKLNSKTGGDHSSSLSNGTAISSSTAASPAIQPAAKELKVE